jgi:hypothetical protein
VKPAILVQATASATPHIVISNFPHTVLGGRHVACSAVQASHRPIQTGCELISVVTAPRARVTYTLTYQDGSMQRYVAVADSKGQSQHLFAVAFMPPAPKGTHSGSPFSIRSVARITIQAVLPGGAKLASASIRFAVMRG